MLPTAVLGGVVVALVIVAVSLRVGVRLVHDSTRPRRLLLSAVSVVAGAVLGAATVFFVHYASWTASLRTHQFGPDTGVVHRPNWFPSLAIAIGIGAVVGAAAAGVMQSAGVRLVSSREPRAQLRATTR